MVAEVLGRPRRTVAPAEQAIGQDLVERDVVGHGPGPAGLLGPRQVGPGLGDATHVGDGVVERLELAAPGPHVLDLGRKPGVAAARHRGQDRDLVGRRDPVAGAAASPLTQIRHVSRTWAKVAPYRSVAALRTSATVAPGTSSRPVPAASRAAANRRNTGTR